MYLAGPVLPQPTLLSPSLLQLCLRGLGISFDRGKPSFHRLQAGSWYLGGISWHSAFSNRPERAPPWTALALLCLRAAGTPCFSGASRSIWSSELHWSGKRSSNHRPACHFKRLFSSSPRLAAMEAASALELCGILTRCDPLPGISSGRETKPALRFYGNRLYYNNHLFADSRIHHSKF